MDNSRRNFLAIAAMAPFLLAAKPKANAAANACYDPAKLSLADKNNRRAVSFVEVSTDASRRCGLCAFYDVGAGNCGKCKLFAGMPTNSAAYCDSFAAAPKG